MVRASEYSSVTTFPRRGWHERHFSLWAAFFHDERHSSPSNMQTLHCQGRMWIWSRQPFVVFAKTNFPDPLSQCEFQWTSSLHHIHLPMHYPTGPWQHTQMKFMTKKILPIACKTNLMGIKDMVIVTYLISTTEKHVSKLSAQDGLFWCNSCWSYVGVAELPETSQKQTWASKGSLKGPVESENSPRPLQKALHLNP